MSSYNLPARINNSLSEVNSGMIESIGCQGGDLIEQTLNQDRNFISRAFDSRLRAVRKGDLKIIEVEQQSRRELLLTVKATHLQVLRESCNQYLARGKAASRAETTRFLLEQAQRLIEEADRISDRFIDNIENRSRKLDTISTPRLRQMLEQQIDKEVQDFLNLRDQLTAKFRSIVSEGV